MNPARLTSILGPLLAVCLGATYARADDAAAAQALFDEAKALMGEKRFAEACPKLEESARLDPGVGTTYQLAVCYEGQGKIASAWAKFKDVESQARAAGQSVRADHARDRALDLEPKLVRMVIDVPAASRVEGLSVRRGGTEVNSAVWGTALPVDPGEVEIIASAPGYESWTSKRTLAAGQPVTTLTIPKLVRAAEPTPAPLPEPAPPVTASANPVLPPTADSGGGPGPWPWVAISVGAAGLVVGGLAGVVVLDKKSKLDDGCPDGGCPPALKDEHASFNRWRTVSTIGFAVGVVGIGSGAILLLTTGKDEQKPHVAARVGPGHVGLAGRFW